MAVGQNRVDHPPPENEETARHGQPTREIWALGVVLTHGQFSPHSANND